MSASESFEEYVTAQMPALLRTAYLLTGHRHDAEDLVQSTLVKCVSAWKRIEHNPDGYVRRVMVNDNISRWRRHRGREVLTEHPPETGATGGDPADGLALQRALSRLAPRQRAVIVLRYYEDLTERETADILGVAVGTVKSQTRDALRRLRVALPNLRLDIDEQDESAPVTP